MITQLPKPLLPLFHNSFQGNGSQTLAGDAFQLRSPHNTIELKDIIWKVEIIGQSDEALGILLAYLENNFDKIEHVLKEMWTDTITNRRKKK